MDKMNKLLIAVLIVALSLIAFIIGVQCGIHSAYKRIANGEVVVVPTQDSYQLEWKK